MERLGAEITEGYHPTEFHEAEHMRRICVNKLHLTVSRSIDMHMISQEREVSRLTAIRHQEGVPDYLRL